MLMFSNENRLNKKQLTVVMITALYPEGSFPFKTSSLIPFNAA